MVSFCVCVCVCACVCVCLCSEREWNKVSDGVA